MNNFEGAALVPGSVCKLALDDFTTARDKFMSDWDEDVKRLKKEKTISRVWFLFAWKETKWDAVCRYQDRTFCYLKESAIRRLGFVSDDKYDDWEYFNDEGYYASSSVKQLTNNGIRDAYLNPEQAAFVNRWGK